MVAFDASLRIVEDGNGLGKLTVFMSLVAQLIILRLIEYFW
jgi:hypothetical protein